MIHEALAELDTYLRLAILEPELRERAEALSDFATERLRTGDQTVVALAGATGSGKSSLFNALSGTKLAAVAAKRPTTSKPLALSFSATNGPLLNLLRITRRYEAVPPSQSMADVVLLDLPDHDSTHLAHREEVDRLIKVIDQFIFVVDPQKYADAALHQRYLRPLAAHRDVISVVLNHADTVTGGEPLTVDGRWHPKLALVVEDLRRILYDDGLGDIRVFATNAVDGAGIGEVRDHIARIATAKRATRMRLGADLYNLMDEFHVAGGIPSSVDEDDVAALQDEVAGAAGVDRMAESVRRAVQRRGAMLTARASSAPAALELPPHQVASAADDARAATAVRRFVAASTENLPAHWRDEARTRLGRTAGEQLGARIDATMRDVDLTDLESPVRWSVVRMLKWLPVVALVACGGWLVFEVVWGSGEFAPRLVTIVVAAVVGTLGLSWLGDWLLRLGARRAERQTARRLRAAVDAEVTAGIVTPVAAELEAHKRAESALQRMTGILTRG